MTFVCTVAEEVFRADFFENGSSRAAVINIGYDDATEIGYSLAVGLEPLAGGGGDEYYFHLIEVDGRTGAEHIYWSGRDVRFIPKPDREHILRAVLALTGHILDRFRPERVFCCTFDENPPEDALLKHFLIAHVFEECGYKVRTADSYHGKRIWWMERSGAPPVATDGADG
jgi:hypothetical protein